MSDVTISKELLQDLLDFAENYGYASDYFKEKHGLDAEYNRLVEQVRAILDTPASEVDPVTYTVRWQGQSSGGIDDQWLTEESARERSNEMDLLDSRTEYDGLSSAYAIHVSPHGDSFPNGVVGCNVVAYNGDTKRTSFVERVEFKGNVPIMDIMTLANGETMIRFLKTVCVGFTANSVVVGQP